MVKYVALILCGLALTGCPAPASKDRPHYGANQIINTTVNGPTPYWNFVNVEGQKPTYVDSFGGLAWGNGVNFQLQGSATKTVKITRLRIGPSRGTAVGTQLAQFGIYSTAASGGTPITLPAARQIDSNDSNATAVATLFTGAGTAGVITLNFRQVELYTTDAGVGNYVEWEICAGEPARCPTLRGTGQYFAFTTNAALAGQACDFEIDWTEE